MSGHSKWKTIQHKKGAADARRGKIFSKLSKEIMVIARQGGSDPDKNPALRTVIQKAKGSNMPADNIDRAVKKGAGEVEGVTYEEFMYEGYASGGVGLVVTGLTDNKNRTAAEIRHIFTKHGSSFAQQGSVSRNFERKGQLLVAKSAVAEEKLMEVALEAGAEDILTDDPDQFEVLTEPATFADVSEALGAAEIETLGGEVTLRSLTDVPVADAAIAKSVLRFIDALEDNDDVQSVYANIDIDPAVLPELEAEE